MSERPRTPEGDTAALKSDDDSAGVTRPLPLFYRAPIALDRERHAALALPEQTDFSFARAAHCVYLAAAEFSAAAREYPIVFARDEDEGCFPVALLGLRPGENVCVTPEGRWLARYVPAYVRRYPFLLARTPGAADLSVCIDQAFAGFTTPDRGAALFHADGSHAPRLEDMLALLREFEIEAARTASVCRRLHEFELLEPMQAAVALPGGERYTLRGFECTTRARIKAMTDARLRELVSGDGLELLYAHLFSLANLQTLLPGGRGP